jgi:hypothetical protein
LGDYLPLEDEDSAFQRMESNYSRRDGRESNYGWRGGWCDEESDEEDDDYFYDDDYGYDYESEGDEEEIDDVKILDDKNQGRRSEGKKGDKPGDESSYLDLGYLDR